MKIKKVTPYTGSLRNYIVTAIDNNCDLVAINSRVVEFIANGEIKSTFDSEYFNEKYIKWSTYRKAESKFGYFEIKSIITHNFKEYFYIVRVSKNTDIINIKIFI